MDYPLCDRTVTVYRLQGGQVHRHVAQGCFYQWEDSKIHTSRGMFFERRFLLIQPGDAKILPGDRIYNGVGPEQVDWDAFLPVNVPGLSQVAYVKSWYYDGQVSHTEAGRK